MPVQDRENVRSRILLGGEGMRTYRLREILCGQGDQQEDDAGKGTYGWLHKTISLNSTLIPDITGSKRDSRAEKGISWSSEYPDAS